DRNAPRPRESVATTSPRERRPGRDGASGGESADDAVFAELEGAGTADGGELLPPQEMAARVTSNTSVVRDRGMYLRAARRRRSPRQVRLVPTDWRRCGRRD